MSSEAVTVVGRGGTRSTSSILSYLDISEATGRVLSKLSSIDTLTALILLVSLIAMNVWLFPYIWYFDLDSSKQFGESFGRVAFQSVNGTDDPYAAISSNPIGRLFGWVFFFAFLLPTFIEMTSPILARMGFRMAPWVFWIAVSFDMLSDRPRVAAAMNGINADLATLIDNQFLTSVVSFLIHLVALFCATFGLEFWFAVSSIVCIGLVLRLVLQKSLYKNLTSAYSTTL